MNWVRRNKDRFKKAGIRWLTGLTILLVLLYKLRPDRIFEEIIRNMTSRLLVVLTVAALTSILIRAIRWQLLVRKMDIGTISLWDSVKITSMSWFFALASPGKIGEITRIIWLNKMRTEQVGLLAIEHFFNLLSLLLITLIATWLHGSHQGLVMLASVVAIASVFWFFLYTDISKYSTRIVRSFLIHYDLEKLRMSFIHTSRRLFRHLSLTILVLSLTLSLTIINLSLIYIVFKELSIQMPFLEAVSGFGISQMVGILTLIPMGLGTRELAGVMYFAGYNKALILSGLLLWRFVPLLMALVGYGFYLTCYSVIPVTVGIVQENASSVFGNIAEEAEGTSSTTVPGSKREETG